MVPTRKLPSRLHHAAYTTKDMERTRQFYEEVIGLPLVATWSEGIVKLLTIPPSP